MSRLLHVLLLLALALPVPARAGMTILGVEEPPGSYAAGRGEAQGISVDYVREIQRRVGNSDPVRIVPETTALQMAETRPNVVAFSFSRTPEREQRFVWIGEVFRKPWVVYVRQASTLSIASLDDMRRIPRLGVTAGDVRALWLQGQNFTNLVPVSSPERNLASLLDGKVDAIFFEPQGVAFYCRKLRCPPGEPRNAWSPRSSGVWILMSKATAADVAARWREAATAIRQDGTYEQIARRWIRRAAIDYRIDSTIRDGTLIFR